MVRSSGYRRWSVFDEGVKAAQRIAVQPPQARHRNVSKKARSRVQRSAGTAGWAALSVGLISRLWLAPRTDLLHAVHLPAQLLMRCEIGMMAPFVQQILPRSNLSIPILACLRTDAICTCPIDMAIV